MHLESVCDRQPAARTDRSFPSFLRPRRPGRRSAPRFRARPDSSRKANGFAAKPGACLALPAADGRHRAGRVRPRGGDQQIPRSVPARRCCRACCRRASIASPTRRMTCVSPRLPLRSVAIASTATARRMRPMSGWCHRMALTWPPSSRMAEAAHACPRPHQYALERHGTGATGARRAAARKRASAPAFNCIVGDELTRQNFPLIHAVGMASPRAPRLIDLSWGDPATPR